MSNASGGYSLILAFEGKGCVYAQAYDDDDDDDDANSAYASVKGRGPAAAAANNDGDAGNAAYVEAAALASRSGASAVASVCAGPAELLPRSLPTLSLPLSSLSLRPPQ